VPDDPGATSEERDDEVERLRAENALLRARMTELSTAAPEEAAARRSRLRGVAVVLAVALSAVAFTGGVIGLWARRSLLNEQVFTQRAAVIGADPAVRAAVSGYLTDQIMTVVDPRALFEQVLPERGRVLAAPLTSAVRGFVGDRVTAFVGSDTFVQLFTRVAANGHNRLVKVIRNESEVVSAQGDTIVVNLVPVINTALAQIGEISPELFGRRIDIPTITADEIPEAARQKLASALGRELSPHFGVIEIQGGGDTLRAAQDAVRLFDLGLWVLVITTFAMAALALWLSARRRRTLLQLAFALIAATVVVRRLAIGVTGEALDQVRQANRAAASAIVDAFVDPLLDFTKVVLVVLLVVALVALATGPYKPAVWLRALVGRLVANVTTLAGSTSPGTGNRTVEWVRGHRCSSCSWPTCPSASSSG
jgi:hypothetical protein